MPDRSSIPNKSPSASLISQMLDAASQYPNKNPAAVALGRLGGLKGGPARASKLSPKRRTDIARKAAKKKWAALKQIPARYRKTKLH